MKSPTLARLAWLCAALLLFPALQLHATVTIVAFAFSKMKFSFWQEIDEIATETDWPGDKVPYGGSKVTALRLLAAFQITLS